MSDSAERRRAFRHPMMLQAQFPDAEGYLSHWTENVSAGGIFIRTDRRFNRGDEVRVELSFPGLLQPLLVEGTVAWTRPRTGETPPGIGIQARNDPARRRLAELAIRAASDRQVQRTQPYHVLIVEDNELVSRMYARTLSHMSSMVKPGVEVTFATNGSEALEACKEQSFDLVITDLYMPVMDGFRLVENLKEKACPPILMVTCGPGEERDKAMGLGVDVFLQKPVQIGQMLETVAQLLRIGGSEPAPSGGQSESAD